MKKFIIKHKECLRRAGRTFVQAAVGYIAANIMYTIPADISDVNVVKTAVTGLIVSSIAAGMAAVMNLQHTE